MRLSAGVEWGVHCATVLAFLRDGRGMPAARLAEYHGVPSAYLAKSLQAMSRAGIVEALPGRNGGYRLSRPPAEITVLDVVETIEGEASSFHCSEIRRRTPFRVNAGDFRVPCAIHVVMDRADAAWRAELRNVSIADVTQMLVEHVSPETLARGGRWIKEVLA